jgi:hypothetical protein
MKSVSTLMILLLLAVMASCGKDNKSGKRNGNYGFNQLGTTGLYRGTGISYNGLSLQQVIQENPCANGAPHQYRIVQTIPAPVNSVIANGDIWVGVTSFGDVAAVGGTPQGPVFQVFACPRSQMTRVSGVPQDIKLLPYTSCGFKQMNASLSLGDAIANFRIMDYGNSAGAKFSYCR